MKLMLLLFGMVILCCKPSEYQLMQDDNNKILLSSSKMAQQQLSFEYTAFSRSTQKHIKIDKDTLYFSKKRDKKFLKLPCKPTLWERIMQQYATVDIDSIAHIKAPSKTFQFDGAPLAKLKITVNGKLYESVPFDHGNPPKEIATLVEGILSATENVE